MVAVFTLIIRAAKNSNLYFSTLVKISATLWCFRLLQTDDFLLQTLVISLVIKLISAFQNRHLIFLKNKFYLSVWLYI
jgi:hypothetical protein